MLLIVNRKYGKSLVNYEYEKKQIDKWLMSLLQSDTGYRVSICILC